MMKIFAVMFVTYSILFLICVKFSDAAPTISINSAIGPGGAKFGLSHSLLPSVPANGALQNVAYSPIHGVGMPSPVVQPVVQPGVGQYPYVQGNVALQKVVSPAVVQPVVHSGYGTYTNMPRNGALQEVYNPALGGGMPVVQHVVQPGNVYNPVAGVELVQPMVQPGYGQYPYVAGNGAPQRVVYNQGLSVDMPSVVQRTMVQPGYGTFRNVPQNVYNPVRGVGYYA